VSSGLFYEPTPEHIAKLSGAWTASFSGGKDSTSLVTWIEWLRRMGRIAPTRPRLVRSDTTVEETALVGCAEKLTEVLEASGWECGLVRPHVHERLYPQILGRGLPPIHPGVRRMRWCTRSTKIDPMNRYVSESSELKLTGLRLGESEMRDKKLRGCAAGGECGIPTPGEGRFSPIINWTTCHVIDWLNGAVDREVTKVMGDVFAVTRQLVEIYGVRIGQPTLSDEIEPTIEASRYGCIGCPAIGAEAAAPRSVIRRNGAGSPLNELYDVWHEARLPTNRLIGFRKGKQVMGPIRMEARKRLFLRICDIQKRAGIVLVSIDDAEFIFSCWERKVYPRGWSEADEHTQAPDNAPLFTEDVA
jgi:3'-phosphoadenosine 5'-phosphosulfate sulfotransferase (PAPS reductase)/FAD synthetase